MTNRSLSGWQRVARSNIRAWGRKTGQSTDRVSRILTSVLKQGNSVEEVESRLAGELSEDVGQSVATEIVEMIKDNVDAKRESIVGYFEEWKNDLKRVKKLLDQNEYYLDAWLILSCYIGALASLRYATPYQRFDRLKYHRIVLKYSGKKREYEKVDLLFLYQWDRSKYRNDRRYRPLKTHYKKVKDVLEVALGSEEVIQSEEGKRYISPSRVQKNILENYNGLSADDLKKILPLFSVCELLYSHVRNHAVHEMEFPLVSKIHEGGSIRYEDNHFITGTLLYDTASSIVETLERECTDRINYPGELPQKRKWQ